MAQPHQIRAILTESIEQRLGVQKIYQQATTDAWRSTFLVPERSPTGAGHLAFFVDHRRVSMAPSRVEAPLLVPVTVRFLFGIAAGMDAQAMLDWDASDMAASHLFGHLLDDQHIARSGIILAPAASRDLWSRQPLTKESERWLMMEVYFQAQLTSFKME